MAIKKQYEIEVNGVTESSKNLTELREEIKRLTSELDQAEFGSAKFSELTMKLAEARDQIKETRQGVDKFVDDKVLNRFVNLGQVVTGAFGLVAAGASVFGKSTEQVEQLQRRFLTLITTLQSLSAIQTALTSKDSIVNFIRIQGVLIATKLKDVAVTRLQIAAESSNTVVRGLATIAQRALNAAMNASPIFILLGVITAVAGAWLLLRDNMDETAESQEKFNQRQKELVAEFKKNQDTIEDLRIAAIEDETKRAVEARKKQRDDDIKQAKEDIKFTEQFEEAKRLINERATQDLIKIRSDANKKIIEDDKKTNDELEKKNKEASDKKLKALEIDFQRQKELAKGNEEETLRLFDEESQKRLTQAKKNGEDTTLLTRIIEKERLGIVKTFSDQRLKIEEDETKKRKDILDKELKAEQTNFQRRKKLAEGNALETLKLFEEEAEERLKIAKENGEDIKLLEEVIDEERTQIIKDGTEKRKAEEIALLEEIKGLKARIQEESIELFNNLLSFGSQLLENQKVFIEKQREQIEKELDATERKIETSKQRIDDLERDLSDSRGERSEELRQAINNEIQLRNELQNKNEGFVQEDIKLKEKQDELEKKRKRIEQARSISSVIISTAEGIGDIQRNPAVNLDITQTLRTLLTGLIIANGAAQIATIAAQKFESGGLLSGPSHSNGGIRGSGRFNNVEVEGGEFIVNKQSTIKYLPLLEKINGGPKRFQTGGVLPSFDNLQNASSTDTLGLSTLVQEIRNLSQTPIEVSVTEINNVQRRLVKISESGNL